jgi:hypothetical protein
MMMESHVTTGEGKARNAKRSSTHEQVFFIHSAAACCAVAQACALYAGDELSTTPGQSMPSPIVARLQNGGQPQPPPLIHVQDHA